MQLTSTNPIWVPSPNFRPGRMGNQVVLLVLHIMQGTLEGTDATFQNPASQVSAHYGIGKDGAKHKYVRVSDEAWHCGEIKNPTDKWNLQHPGQNPNYVAAGIEHEGYSGDAVTDAQFQASLWVCRQVIMQCPGILLDRDHILGHHEIDAYHAGCPGFDVNRWVVALRA